MAKGYFAVAPDVTSAATFRNWGSTISTQIASMGLIRTYQSFTGGTSWTDVPLPASGVAGVVEVYRFADTLQATDPIYFAVEYGVQGTAPAIWLSVGWATDGAGTITGAGVFPRTRLSCSSNSTVSSHCFISGDVNRLALALFTNTGSSGQPITIAIERTKDSSGNDTNTGIIVFAGYPTTPGMNLCVPRSGVAPSLENYWASPYNSDATTRFVGDVFIGVPAPLLGGPQYPGINVATVQSSDFNNFVQIPLQMYGTTRTYIHCGSNILNLNQNTASRLIMLWS